MASAFLSLIELVYFYCQKVQGVNLEFNTKTMKPFARNKFVRGYGFCSIFFAIGVIIIGFYAFDDQGCLDLWFVDEENLCKSCTLYFGAECLDCEDASKCSQCQSGYFFASEDDSTRGIVAETEIRCRPCQEQHGEFCSECDQQQCTVLTGTDAFLDSDTGAVINCETIKNCDSCDATGCVECIDGFYLDNQTKQCKPCSEALPNCL